MSTPIAAVAAGLPLRWISRLLARVYRCWRVRPWLLGLEPHRNRRVRCYLNDTLPEPYDSERKPIGVTLGDSLQAPADVRGKTPTSVLCNVTLPVIPA